jgi:hypothetical protein
MIIDLAVVNRALDALATSEQGTAALDQFAAALDQFRANWGVEMNDAEFRYCVERLMQQRTLPGDQPEPVAEISADEYNAYVFPTAGGGPTAAPEPAGLRSQAFTRVLPHGFFIRADADAAL